MLCVSGSPVPVHTAVMLIGSSLDAGSAMYLENRGKWLAYGSRTTSSFIRFQPRTVHATGSYSFRR